eukprot:CAMPEP_0170169088 /NCGR_PEP_ID=MMETSP0040_2-20121228/2022_1 /TAXON_ID=641309 /ORGANISM="Lotharella oceanica, Strain CCMP622" /LENGTH=168 /DNA_ID=CAMNT_0010407635 /DNA_START=31 /DNA_END=538 /DNA_ORIENTATION=-
MFLRKNLAGKPHTRHRFSGTPEIIMSSPDGDFQQDGETVKTWNWKFDPSLSADENYIRLTLVLARNSKYRGGGMGAVLTRSGAVLARAINNDKGHAEANALDICESSGIATQGANAMVAAVPFIESSPNYPQHAYDTCTRVHPVTFTARACDLPPQSQCLPASGALRG